MEPEENIGRSSKNGWSTAHAAEVLCGFLLAGLECFSCFVVIALCTKRVPPIRAPFAPSLAAPLLVIDDFGMRSRAMYSALNHVVDGGLRASKLPRDLKC
jgi:hypothetical protein